MSALRLSDEEAASLRAVVLLQRFSLGLDRVAQRALGGSENADVQALLVVAAHDGVSPTDGWSSGGPRGPTAAVRSCP